MTQIAAGGEFGESKLLGPKEARRLPICADQAGQEVSSWRWRLSIVGFPSSVDGRRVFHVRLCRKRSNARMLPSPFPTRRAKERR